MALWPWGVFLLPRRLAGRFKEAYPGLVSSEANDILIELAIGQVIDDTTGAPRDDHTQRKDHPYIKPELARSLSS